MMSEEEYKRSYGLCTLYMDTRKRFIYINGEPDKCGWYDATIYKGRMVPLDILDSLYQVANIDRLWLEGGRDLDLSWEAWDFLDLWAAGERAATIV
jgi:hypothetical protein